MNHMNIELRMYERPLAKSGSDRIGPDRIGFDWIDKTRSGSITKSLPKVSGHQTTR